MSKIIASAAIRGAHKIVEQAEDKWQKAMDTYGANEPVGFPNTAYYLPVIYGILGIPVEKLGDMEEVLNRCKNRISIQRGRMLPRIISGWEPPMMLF
jgi:acetyl-CoA synthase